jgi:hypothetical protein
MNKEKLLKIFPKKIGRVQYIVRTISCVLTAAILLVLITFVERLKPPEIVVTSVTLISVIMLLPVVIYGVHAKFARCNSAYGSPWVGLLMAVPIINVFLFVTLLFFRERDF